MLPELKAPAVLRRLIDHHGDVADGLEGISLEEGVPRYEFVGASYVHGTMDGEAIRGKESKLQDIALVRG